MGKKIFGKIDPKKRSIIVKIMIAVLVVLFIAVGVLILVLVSSSGKETDIDKDDQKKEQESDENEDDDELSLPTIKLSISSGPTRDAEDNLCIYKVKATVTGNPEPEVSFSRNDNSGSSSTNETTINLYNGEEYTLSARAENSEGTDETSIVLKWDCPIVVEFDFGEDDDGGDGEDSGDGDVDGDDGPQTEEFHLINSMCGSVRASGVYATSFVYIGDDSLDRMYKGYLTFDISGLRDVTIIDARVVISDLDKSGDPTFASRVDFKHFEYGFLTDDDFAVGGTSIHHMPTSPLSNMTFWSSGLTDTLQDMVDDRRDWYQIKIGLNRSTDSDGAEDGVEIENLSGVYLRVTYE